MSANLRTKYAAIVIAHIVTVLYLLFTLIKTKLKEQTNERFGPGIASAAWARQHSELSNKHKPFALNTIYSSA